MNEIYLNELIMTIYNWTTVHSENYEIIRTDSTSIKYQDIRELTNQTSSYWTILKNIEATYFERLNNQERRVDALALRADERRDKLRKAAVRSKYPLTRRYLNGETRQEKLLSLHTEYIGM